MEKKKNNDWIRQLLMTMIGTTLSIVLTFGTSAIIDNNKKKAEGRQMAMMVIHDIDNTAESFRTMSRNEKRDFLQSQALLTRLDAIDQVGADTLNAVLMFVLNESGGANTLDDSSEQLFLSSQDTWKNIDNAAFIDAVTEFYLSRRQTYESINHGIIWVKPVDEDVFYSRQMTSPNYMVDEARFLSEQLRQDRVRYYIECSPARQRAYNQIADVFEMTSNRCKFLMGITDSEMQKYIETRNHPGKPVKDKDLPGKWVITSNDDLFQGFEFKEDHTLTSTIIQHYIDPFFTGRIDLHFNYHGSWEMKGDSLITVISKEYTYSFDTTAVGHLPGKEQYVKQVLNNWRTELDAQMAASTSEEGSRLAHHVAIDPSGNRIEMITEEAGDNNNFYITREK